MRVNLVVHVSRRYGVKPDHGKSGWENRAKTPGKARADAPSLASVLLFAAAGRAVFLDGLFNSLTGFAGALLNAP